MIIMNCKFENLVAFDKFSINFSYPRKIVRSLIKGEHLEGKENFRYKKVNIIMGSNANGKTSFGRLLNGTLKYIVSGTEDSLIDLVNDKRKIGVISIDIVLSDKDKDYLYRFDITIEKEIKMLISKCLINKDDNYEICVSKLKEIDYATIKKELAFFRSSFSWYFTYPENRPFLNTGKKNETLYLKLLKMTLMTLDPSIKTVNKINKIKDSYVIEFPYSNVILQEGKGVNSDLFSSGTKNGIDICNILYSIIKGESTLFYCDEKFTHIHSELESAFFTFMITFLKPNTQLFFTTHNTDLLDLTLPKHSFNFFNKINDNNNYSITSCNVGDYLKRNTDSVKNSYFNDVFSSLPKTDLIDNYIEENEEDI